MRSQEIQSKCTNLRQFWSKRNTKMREWYKVLEMVDELAQEDMESFVGNDPRAAYNLIVHMLDSKIPHRIDPDYMTDELIGVADEVETIFRTAWNDIFLRYRTRGKTSWMRDFLGFLAATGWYAVFAQVTPDGTRCMAEIWNPIEVFPNFDDDMMVECAHIFPISAIGAQRLISRNEWAVNLPRQKSLVYDYWWVDAKDEVYNSIAIGSTVVKDSVREARFHRIPIFVAPTGGLPDMGSLCNAGGQYLEEMGQSFLATNLSVFKNLNKWWTFQMQLMRDTAQPRWFEQTSSGTKIISPENVFKRGAIFRGGLQDKISTLDVPPMPVELRSSLLDMEAMLQRGGPSWAMYGNISQPLTAYVMSQIAASANQMAKPFHQSVINLLTDIDNFWLELMRSQNYKPYKLEIPEGLEAEVRISAAYEIRIPGDLANRATTARMLDPNFQLSTTRVMRDLFPEISNPLQEQAAVRADQAKRNPIMAALALIDYLDSQAEELREGGDRKRAELFATAAESVRSSLGVAEEEAAAGGLSPGLSEEELGGRR